jgi:hypothetical protein
MESTLQVIRDRYQNDRGSIRVTLTHPEQMATCSFKVSQYVLPSVITDYFNLKMEATSLKMMAVQYNHVDDQGANQWLFLTKHPDGVHYLVLCPIKDDGNRYANHAKLLSYMKLDDSYVRYGDTANEMAFQWNAYIDELRQIKRGSFNMARTFYHLRMTMQRCKLAIKHR